MRIGTLHKLVFNAEKRAGELRYVCETAREVRACLAFFREGRMFIANEPNGVRHPAVVSEVIVDGNEVIVAFALTDDRKAQSVVSINVRGHLFTARNILVERHAA